MPIARKKRLRFARSTSFSDRRVFNLELEIIFINLIILIKHYRNAHTDKHVLNDFFGLRGSENSNFCWKINIGLIEITKHLHVTDTRSALARQNIELFGQIAEMLLIRIHTVLDFANYTCSNTDENNELTCWSKYLWVVVFSTATRFLYGLESTFMLLITILSSQKYNLKRVTRKGRLT